MQQGFPLELTGQLLNDVASIHALGALLIIAVVAAVIAFARLAAAPWMMLCLGLFVILATKFTLMLNLDEEVSVVITPVASIYACVILPVAAVGLVMTMYRLRRKKLALRNGVLLALLPCAVHVALSHFAVPEYRGGTRHYCRNNLKHVALALYNYHQSELVLPPASSGEPAVSWRVRILPHLGLGTAYNNYDQSQPWDSDANLSIAKGWGRTSFQCPTNPHPTNPAGCYYTDYAMVTGKGTVGENPAGTPLAGITDGHSTTILVVEASGLEIVWTEPRDIDVTKQPIGVNLLGSGATDSPGLLSSYHPMGAHIVLADGSVRFINQTIDRKVLGRMTSIAGNDDIATEE